MFPGNGLFASPRLERLLLEIGKTIPTDPANETQRTCRNSRHVLHVLTYAKPIGGDSRYAWRWIQRDSNSRHSVAITAQAEVKHLYEIPGVLEDAVARSGGSVQLLSAPISEPLDQARELRRLCQNADIVVLHLYPYDIIPVLALAAGCDSAKTLFVNHSDHTFWIGASVAHSVVHLRTQSATFLETRRALNPDRSSILPIPLVNSPSAATKRDAKRALGYDPDRVMLLTIASRFKYSSPDQIGLLELVLPVLARFPRAILVAVGPKGRRRVAGREDTNKRKGGRRLALNGITSYSMLPPTCISTRFRFLRSPRSWRQEATEFRFWV